MPLEGYASALPHLGTSGRIGGETFNFSSQRSAITTLDCRATPVHPYESCQLTVGITD